MALSLIRRDWGGKVAGAGMKLTLEQTGVDGGEWGGEWGGGGGRISLKGRGSRDRVVVNVSLAVTATALII